MKHIKKIKEGLLRTTIMLVDDNNKKSKVGINNIPIRKEIRKIGPVKKMVKIPKIMNLYKKIASEEEIKYAQANMKDNIYGMISTQSLIAINNAFENEKLDGETIKEFFSMFWNKEKNKEIDKLKVDIKSINVERKMEKSIDKNISKDEEFIK